MNSLQKYLNQHLSGSHAALNLLQTLVRMNGPETHHYQQLHDSVAKNQMALAALLRQAGFPRDRATELAAPAGSFLAVLRFKTHGLRTGGLGLMEALEALQLGVQGQLLLWNNVLLPGVAVPPWKKEDLAALRQSAEEQLYMVEALRVKAVKQTLCGAPPARPLSA